MNMKAKYLLSILSVAFFLTSCENYFDAKYLDNGDPYIAVVKTEYYTLTDADYSTIAKNKNNQLLAASLDTIEGDSTNRKALERLGKQKYFDSIALPKYYLPAFIYNKYPHLDRGSVFKMTYRVWEGLPEFLDTYKALTRYNVSIANYDAIWNDGSKRRYLIPANETEVLKYIPAGEEGAMRVAKYSFALVDGATPEVKEVLCIYENDAWKLYGTREPATTFMPTAYSSQMDKWVAENYNYSKKGDSLIVLCFNASKANYTVGFYRHDDTEWQVQTGIVDETSTYGLGDVWSEMPVYYKQALAGDPDQGLITTYNYDLEDPLTYIWAFSSAYGMKGTAYYSGPHTGEGWFVTPSFQLKNATAPVLSFDHAINYGPQDDSRYEQMTVWVSTDFDPTQAGADIHSATWTQIPWPEYNGKKFDDANEIGFPDANSWTFYNSGNLDLSAWKNQSIVIGFRYKSVKIDEETYQTCATWEVKNIVVQEP